MPDRVPPRSDGFVPAHPPGPHTPTSTSTARANGSAREDRVVCDRCGAEMFRMHAVWRCPACGYKTDCCGW
ncbi:MAG TPA: hypothetical protein VES67_00760 [Vicinamibacterales bacterium]|nr:hypothetical protein [Vicinamibacterales bacterium]